MSGSDRDSFWIFMDDQPITLNEINRQVLTLLTALNEVDRTVSRLRDDLQDMQEELDNRLNGQIP